MTADQGQAVFEAIIELVLSFYITGLPIGYAIKIFKQLWKGDNDDD